MNHHFSKRFKSKPRNQEFIDATVFVKPTGGCGDKVVVERAIERGRIAMQKFWKEAAKNKACTCGSK